MKTEDLLKTTKDVLELSGFICSHVSGEYDNAINLYICNAVIEDSELITLDVINSVQHIVGRLLYSKNEPKEFSFIIDINETQKKQIETIKKQADLCMEKAKSVRESVSFPPMTAYERLLVHTYIASFDSFSTESQGDGLGRCVVVYYNK